MWNLLLFSLKSLDFTDTARINIPPIVFIQTQTHHSHQALTFTSEWRVKHHSGINTKAAIRLCGLKYSRLTYNWMVDIDNFGTSPPCTLVFKNILPFFFSFFFFNESAFISDGVCFALRLECRMSQQGGIRYQGRFSRIPELRLKRWSHRSGRKPCDLSRHTGGVINMGAKSNSAEYSFSCLKHCTVVI